LASLLRLEPVANHPDQFVILYCCIALILNRL